MSGVNSDSEITDLVEIDADLLLHARLVADDLAGRYAAHRDLAWPGPRFWMVRPATLRDRSSMVVAAARWMSSSVCALIEKGTRAARFRAWSR